MRSYAVRDLLERAPFMSRRNARRVRCWLYLDDGTKVGADDALPVDEQWRQGILRRRAVRYRLAPPPLIALNKPPACITSRKGEAGAATVFDVLNEPSIAARVEPVGRLDRDTTGLLLLTGDGELLHRLTHPKRAIEREYHAEVRGTPAPDGVAAALRGELALRDGERPHPVVLEMFAKTASEDDLTTWRVVLTEGRYHEVRRLFGALGTRVVKLHRTRYANLELGEPPCALQSGEHQRIEGEHMRRVYDAVSLAVPAPVLEVDWLISPMGAASEDSGDDE
jgi:pseudouridine synthase